MAVPDAFVLQMEALLGEQADSLLNALESPAPVSVRLNPLKPLAGSIEPLVSAPVPWSSQGRYLKERPSFTFDPLFHAGHYYVQEASSMFVEQAFRLALSRMEHSSSVKVLDLCASPGGKSTLLSSLLPASGLLVANEVIRSRASVLVETIRKWGHPNVMVTNNDPSDFSGMAGYFDVMLVDAPCSGEGMFRKDPESVNEWSPDQVKHCAARQRNILSDILPSLKPGGYLIYSTCTYNLDEDESVVNWLRDEWNLEPVGIPVDGAWGVTGSLDVSHPGLPVYRFMPHKAQGEGFFLCLLQKPFQHVEERLKQVGERTPKRTKNTPPTNIKLIPSTVRNYVSEPDGFVWNTTPKGQLYAVPKSMSEDHAWICTRLHVLHAGVMVGEMKGSSFIPHPSLALSGALNRKAVPSCDLALKQAIDYLRGEAMVLPSDCPVGWVLVSFKGQALGWMKNIGQRANNGWPAEWRIRSKNPF